MKSFLVIITLACWFSSCTTIDVFEQTKKFPTQEWSGKDTAYFKFNISDTTAAYHIYVVLRHTDAYHYNNIWLQVATMSPMDTTRNQLVNVPLANNANGWLGTGMDDIFDHRARITRTAVKLKKGSYVFKLVHAMREEPLQSILSAGIRVEKARL